MCVVCWLLFVVCCALFVDCGLLQVAVNCLVCGAVSGCSLCVAVCWLVQGVCCLLMHVVWSWLYLLFGMVVVC